MLVNIPGLGGMVQEELGRNAEGGEGKSVQVKVGALLGVLSRTGANC